MRRGRAQWGLRRKGRGTPGALSSLSLEYPEPLADSEGSNVLLKINETCGASESPRHPLPSEAPESPVGSGVCNGCLYTYTLASLLPSPILLSLASY